MRSVTSTDNYRNRRAAENAFIHIRGEKQTGQRSGLAIATRRLGIPDAFVTTEPAGTQVPT